MFVSSRTSFQLACRVARWRTGCASQYREGLANRKLARAASLATLDDDLPIARLAGGTDRVGVNQSAWRSAGARSWRVRVDDGCRRPGDAIETWLEQLDAVRVARDG